MSGPYRNNPCLECPDRIPALCHAACAAYREYRRPFDAAARQRSAERDATGVAIENIIKMKKRRHVFR